MWAYILCAGGIAILAVLTFLTMVVTAGKQHEETNCVSAGFRPIISNNLRYGTVSKVVLSGREQAGQEALRPNQISNEGSHQTIEKR